MNIPSQRKSITITPLTFPREWRLPVHQHEAFHELIVICSGAIETQMDGQTLVGKRGSALLYPRSTPHAERAVGGQPLRMILLTFTGELPQHPPALRNFSDGRCELIARWMLEESSGDAPPRQSSPRSATPSPGPLFSRWFDALLACFLTPAPESAALPLAAVRRFVQEHFAWPLTLADLAAVAASSPFHFARQFRAAFDLPPMTYVRRVRVEAARALLLTTSMPLRAIAPLVGFADERELLRVFKRETGQTPGSVRRVL